MKYAQLMHVHVLATLNFWHVIMWAFGDHYATTHKSTFVKFQDLGRGPNALHQMFVRVDHTFKHIRLIHRISCMTQKIVWKFVTS